jgi:hypothetical protein
MKWWGLHMFPQHYNLKKTYPLLKYQKWRLCFPLLLKGSIWPDWICMGVVPLESHLKGHQPLYVFDFLISVLTI